MPHHTGLPVYIFEIRFHYGAQDSLELTTNKPLPLVLDDRRKPVYLAEKVILTL